MMELSINTLVVLILGILVVGGGIALVGSIIAETEDLLPKIGQAEQKQLVEKLQRGERVVITNNVKQGSYGDYTFGLGFKNSLPQDRNFTVEITPRTIVNRNGDVQYHVTDIDMPAAFYVEEEITLQPGEQHTDLLFNIDIEKGLPRGTYTYEVRVKYDDEGTLKNYADPLQVMITVQ